MQSEEGQLNVQARKSVHLTDLLQICRRDKTKTCLSIYRVCEKTDIEMS